MHNKFEINWTKIKGGCQLGRKVVTHNSKLDLPLAILLEHTDCKFEINWTWIKGGCQWEKKFMAHNSKCDLPLLGSI